MTNYTEFLIVEMTSRKEQQRIVSEYLQEGWTIIATGKFYYHETKEKPELSEYWTHIAR